MKFHLYRGEEAAELLAEAAESEEVKVDAIVKGIPHEAFMYWKNLQQVQLPEGLQIIEQGAFAYCTSLLEIRLPSTVKVLQDMVFVDCTSLTTVWLSDAIQVLEQSLFENCIALKEIHMPSSLNLTTIKDSCFASCRSLPSLLLPFGLQKIGDWAFARCESMTSLSVPSTVTHVGRYCFQQCYELLSLEFPQGLSFIGDHCFVDCSNLRSMVIPVSFEFAGSYPLLDRSLLKTSFPDVERDTYEDESLVELLNYRFVNLPIHNACYHLCQQQQQQNHSLDDDDASDYYLHHLEELIVNEYEKTDEESPNLDSWLSRQIQYQSSLDGFGMNPLHLLCLSGIPNTRACQLLLENAAGWNSSHGQEVSAMRMRMVHCRDLYGGTPMAYLCWNRAPGTKELCETIFRVVVTTRLEHIRLDDWKQVITTAMTSALEHWDHPPQEEETTGRHKVYDRLELVGRVFYALEYHERKESLSFLECSLWKLQMNLLYGSEHSNDHHEQRRECRIQCGADVVIPNVLSFLRPLEEGKYLNDFIRSG